MTEEIKNGKWVYARYVTKNGVRIYPKNSRFFRFWVADENQQLQDNDKYAQQ